MMADQIYTSESKKQRFLRRLGALNTERQSWIHHWRELADYVSPRSARFLVSDRNKGVKANQKILNNRATLAHRRCAAGMMSGLTNPAQPWFALSTPDTDIMGFVSVRTWLYAVTKIMQDVMARSNLYTQLQLVYESESLHGTSPMAIYEDDEDVIRAQTFPVGSYTLANDSRGRVDTLYREYQMTVRQLVQEFGLSACSDLVQGQYRNGSFEQWIDVVYLVEPNDDRNPDKATSKHKRYRSVHFEKGGNEDQLLRESGFDEFPIMVGRWRVTGEDVYAESPGMQCLGDIKELQYNERKKKQAIAKMVEPPLVAPSSLRGRVTGVAGEVNYVEANAGSNPAVTALYQVNFDVNGVRQENAEIEQRIASTFFEDVFLAISSIEKAGTREIEISERIQERLLQLGPVILQNNDDLFDPLIDRIFAVCWRRGLLPPPPDELAGVQLKVEYTGLLQQALRGVSSGITERFMTFVANGAQLFPELMDVIDPDKMADEYAVQIGVTPTMLRDQDGRDAARQQRAQQQQAAQMAAMAQPAAQAAQAAQTLSQTPVGDTNALQALAGARQQ